MSRTELRPCYYCDRHTQSRRGGLRAVCYYCHKLSRRLKWFMRLLKIIDWSLPTKEADELWDRFTNYEQSALNLVYSLYGVAKS